MTDPDHAIQAVTDLIRHVRTADHAISLTVDAWEQLDHTDRVELGQRFPALVDGILRCVEARGDHDSG